MAKKTTTINWKDQLVRPLPTIVALSKRDCPRGKYALKNEEFTTFVFLPYDWLTFQQRSQTIACESMFNFYQNRAFEREPQHLQNCTVLA